MPRVPRSISRVPLVPLVLAPVTVLLTVAGLSPAASAAVAAPAAAPAAAVAPAPHPVAPKMQVLRPRGVDAKAVAALAASTPQLRSALAGSAADVHAPALATAPTATSTFQLVGLTWAAKGAPAGITISVRLREKGAWGSWQDLGVEDAGPDANTAEGRAAAATAGSDPLLSDGADGVQVVVHTASGTAPADLKVDLINAGTSSADGEPATPAAATTPATTTATTTPSEPPAHRRPPPGPPRRPVSRPRSAPRPTWRSTTHRRSSPGPSGAPTSRSASRSTSTPP